MLIKHDVVIVSAVGLVLVVALAAFLGSIWILFAVQLRNFFSAKTTYERMSNTAQTNETHDTCLANFVDMCTQTKV